MANTAVALKIMVHCLGSDWTDWALKSSSLTYLSFFILRYKPLCSMFDKVFMKRCCQQWKKNTSFQIQECPLRQIPLQCIFEKCVHCDHMKSSLFLFLICQTLHSLLCCPEILSEFKIDCSGFSQCLMSTETELETIVLACCEIIRQICWVSLEWILLSAVRLHCNSQNVMRRRVKLYNHGVFLGITTGDVWKSGSSKCSF